MSLQGGFFGFKGAGNGICGNYVTVEQTTSPYPQTGEQIAMVCFQAS
jgi:hypothetical protein